MHPLSDNLKSLTFEELEKRSSDILKRMQIMRRAQISNPQIWDQLEMLLDGVNDEKMERAMALNSANPKADKTVIVSTDPLDDEIAEEPKAGNRGFNPIT